MTKGRSKNKSILADSENKYISLAEASELCEYSQEYLSLRARQGKLKAVKLGRNWVTTSDWVAEYCEHNGNGNVTALRDVEHPEDVQHPNIVVVNPPEDLPVGELVVYSPKFKDWLATKKPVSS